MFIFVVIGVFWNKFTAMESRLECFLFALSNRGVDREVRGKGISVLPESALPARATRLAPRPRGIHLARKALWAVFPNWSAALDESSNGTNTDFKANNGFGPEK